MGESNWAGKVFEREDLQKKVTKQRKHIEPMVRALFTVCDIEEKVIV